MSVPGTFWNLSNHPSQHWPTAQSAAARTWGDHVLEVRDLPFPSVDPSLGTEDILELARHCTHRLLEAGARPGEPVMVMGEFGLSFALVHTLKALGFVPLAATSRREAVERRLEDGSVVKEGCFRFVRFRAY